MAISVYVAGHQGMVGSALLRAMENDPETQIIFRSRQELDLTDQKRTRQFFLDQKPEQVFVAAAKVGGIHANHAFPADFIYQNLMIAANIIQAAHEADVQKLLFLGSSCVYPKYAEQPISEEALMSGYLESTNEPYAIAKIAGIKLCESYNRQHQRDYRSVMPTNLYGPGDNFHPENSHVVPALIRRFHEAVVESQEQVVVWGSGNVRREFLYVDDMAAASRFVMNMSPEDYRRYTRPMVSHLNVGSGVDLTIRELAMAIAEVVGFSGTVAFDQTKPEGTPRKQLDVSKLRQLGWTSTTALRTGLQKTYQWFLENPDLVRNLS